MARKYKVVTFGMQKEIRRLNAAGISDRQISIQLGMYEENVRKHRKAMGLPNSLEVKKQLAAKREAEWDAKQMHRNDATRSKQKKPAEIKLVDEYCEGCIYLTDFHFDNVKSICYYNVINDKKRPCKAGQGCTEKCVGKRKPTPVDLW